jgi:SAM-dependent methyltransferase
MRVSCIVCQNEANSFTHPRTGVVFHACSRCSLIFKDRSHFPTLEEERAVYENHENSIEDVRYVNFLRNFLEAAVYPYKKRGRVLDFGSGPNPVLKEIFAADGNDDVTIYDAFYAPNDSYKNKTYDIITMSEVIEHLHRPNETIALLSRLLEPGGILAIMTLFYPTDRDRFFDWFYIRDPSHVAFYRPDTLSFMAKRHGLTMIDTNGYRYATLKK